MAAGAVVVSLCSTSDETIEEAEKISRATSARLSKAATASAKPINVPTSISLTGGWGNHLRRQKKMYEYMAEFKAVHVMQLPNSASDAASRALWKTEILRLQQVIEARFGTPISEAALREAIVLKIASAGRWPTLSSRAAQSAGAQRRRHPESGVRRHFSFRQNRPD